MRWQERAACKDDPRPDDWFAPGSAQAERARALAVCLGCPVRSECLAFHLSVERTTGDQVHGVAGGLTAPARRRMLVGA